MWLCSILVCSISLFAVAQPTLTVVGGATISFGDIYYAKKVSRDIHILNSGSETLTITGIETFCSCTKAKITSKSIAPSSSAVLTLTFDPKVFQGSISKAIQVKSNDQSNPSIPIMFTANVFKLLELKPDYVFFGAFPSDSSVTKTLVLKNVSPNPLKILRIVPAQPFVQGKVRKSALTPGEETELVVTATPRKPMSVQGQLELITDEKIAPKVVVKYGGIATQRK